MIRRPPRSTLDRSSAASDVYKRQIKSYTNPETESGPPFLFNIVGAGITILTIESFSLESSAFAVYYLILATTLFVLIQFKIGPRLRVGKLENI